MGCHWSKMPASTTSKSQSFNHFLNEPPTYIAVNVSHRPLSLDTLNEVATRHLENKKKVVRVILDQKEKIRKNPELLLIVKDYLDKGLHTLDFGNAHEMCFEIAKDFQLVLHPSIKDGGGTEYEKTIVDELKPFKGSCDLVTKEIIQVFQSLLQHQPSLIEKLDLQNNKLNKKLKSVKKWKKRSCIIFYAAYAGLLIFLITAAIVGLPPIPDAFSTACWAMKKRLNSTRKKYMKAIKREKKIINELKAGTYIRIYHMNEIMVMVKTMLVDQISSLPEEAVLMSGIEKIKKNMELLLKSIENLVAQANQNRREIELVSTLVLQMISKHPE